MAQGNRWNSLFFHFTHKHTECSTVYDNAVNGQKGNLFSKCRKEYCEVSEKMPLCVSFVVVSSKSAAVDKIPSRHPLIFSTRLILIGGGDFFATLKSHFHTGKKSFYYPLVDRF